MSSHLIFSKNATFIILDGCLQPCSLVNILKAYMQMNNKISKGAKIRNRYNQVLHLTQDTNGKVTNSQLDTTNQSQEVSPILEGERILELNTRAKEIQQVNPGGPEKQPQHQVPTISSTDKSLSRNHHRV